MRYGLKLTSLLLACCSFGMSAQVVWLNTDYDFGLMKEAAGPKTGTARFVNIGREPVTVVDAKPSCGCTGAEYPLDPVEPGDTATISFTYNPEGRPGRFDKTVKVIFGDGHRDVIRIRGNVLGTPESLALFYPVAAGPLRLSEPRINAGRVVRGKVPGLFLNAYNQKSDSVTPRITSGSKALSVKSNAARPGPGDIVTIGLYFDSRAWNRPGPFEIPVEIVPDVDDPDAAPVTVMVVGEVIPESNGANAKQLAKAPVCVIAPPVADLGLIDNNPRRFEFSILNNGKSPLVIENVWCANSALTIDKWPEKIKPGKMAALHCELKSNEISGGPFRLEINIATNDPVNPLTVVRVAGEK